MNQQLSKRNNLLLLIGCVLLLIGFLSPNVGSISILPNSSATFSKPTDAVLVELAQPVISALDNSGNDGVTLANLYNDLATLIEIDQEIIKNTEEIREANRISGHMLKLGLKDKYPNLGEAANAMVVSYIGEDNAALSPELRKKSVDVFRALAWACKEGSN